jgi:hypothetical protein
LSLGAYSSSHTHVVTISPPVAALLLAPRRSDTAKGAARATRIPRYRSARNADPL